MARQQPSGRRAFGRAPRTARAVAGGNRIFRRRCHRTGVTGVVPMSGIGGAPVVVSKSETTSEAVARGLRGASLVDFAGKWWFFGSEAVVAGMRKASLRNSR